MDPLSFTLTILIVIVTAGISWKAFSDQLLKSKALFRPVAITERNEWHRFLTHGFIHADMMHLGINMFVLWSFGSQVEYIYTLPTDYGALSGHGPVLGRVFFLLLYLLGIIVASIPSYIKHRNNYHYSALGASGAVSGVVFSAILFFPWENIDLLGIIPIPGIVAGVAYLIYSSYMSKNANDNVGHDAHMYGAIFGFVFTILIRPANLQWFIDRLMEGPSF